MPAGISNLAPTSESVNPYDYEIGKDSPAFTILHKDSLHLTLPMLHMNHINTVTENDQNKNGVTKITSRNNISNVTGNAKNDFYTRKRISKSNDHLVLASLQNQQSNPLRKKQQSKSHDNLGENQEKSKCPKEIEINNVNHKRAMCLSTENFNEVLNAKLKKIQDHEDEQGNKKSGSKKSPICTKKPFITTVKTGEFLMPPPEVAALLGMAPNGDWIGVTNDQNDENDTGGFPRSKFRPLLSLGRRPEVRHSSHNARCPAALKATVDFAASFVNHTNMNAGTNAGSTTEGVSLVNNERGRRVSRFAET